MLRHINVHEFLLCQDPEVNNTQVIFTGKMYAEAKGVKRRRGVIYLHDRSPGIW